MPPRPSTSRMLRTRARHVLTGIRNSALFSSVRARNRIIFLRRGPMYVDTSESRGMRLWREAGVTHLRISHAWRAALSIMEPDLVLDVGANYGEVALSGRYPATADIVLVEPNPALIHYLERSIEARSTASGGRWSLLKAAASNHTGTASFHLNRTSSGLSRLISSEQYSPHGSAVDVDLVRLDELSTPQEKRKILFKIDVEGSEVAALEGLESLLVGADAYCGIVEMRDTNLHDFGTSAFELWNLARRIGNVAVFDRFDQAIDCSQFTYHQLLQEESRNSLLVSHGGDLIMYKGLDNIHALSTPKWVKHIESLAKILIRSSNRRE